MGDARPDISPDRLFVSSTRRKSRWIGSGKLGGEKSNTPRRQFEQDRGNEEEIERTDFLHQQRRSRPSGDPAQGSTYGDESKEPLALVGVKNIGHERPEDRDDKEIEDTYPYEERPAHPNLLRRRRHLHQEIEKDEVGDEKAIDNRDEAPA